MQIDEKNIPVDADFVKQVITLRASIGNDVTPGDALLQIGTLAVSGAVAEKFKTTTKVIFREDSIQRSKDATDELVFDDAYTINTGTDTGDFWGAFLAEATGVDDPVITAKAAAADQAYDTEAEAIAALPEATAGSVAIGYITVQAKTDSAWTANTDDMTAGSDCQAVNFYDLTPLPEETYSDLLVDSFVPGFPFEILGIQHVADQIEATAEYDVKIGSTSALNAAEVPVAATREDAVLAAAADLLGSGSDAINLHCTTDATGLLSGLKVHVTIRPRGLRR